MTQAAEGWMDGPQAAEAVGGAVHPDIAVPHAAHGVQFYESERFMV